MAKSHILIVDDERNTREGLKRALQGRYRITLADNGQRALELIGAESFDVVLTDLRMPGLDGLSFIRQVMNLPNRPVCVMLTAYGSVENAVEAMKAGAYDYLTKPITNLDNLEIVIQRAIESRQLKRENAELKRELAGKFAFANMIGKSVSMQEVFDTLKQIAPARSTVLFTGENGTGKELAVRALHQLSDRADKPFVPVHCAALSPTLLESELFGHEKGAFTHAHERRVGRFEAADGGILFLDEIGEIAPSVQVTLLRVLESRSFERVGGTKTIEVDVRLVAATNKDLKAMVDRGEFREDLYYRLDVLRIEIPPLRERREDIPLLLNHYLAVFNEENAREVAGFTPETVKALVRYDWPGNVRELRNCVERMVVMTRNDTIDVADIPSHIANAVGEVGGPKLPAAGLDIEDNEKRLIMMALRECKGNRTKAAEKLGVSRRTIIRKIQHYGLD